MYHLFFRISWTSFWMPSEIMDQRGVTASSHMFDDVSYAAEVITVLSVLFWFYQFLSHGLKKLMVISFIEHFTVWNFSLLFHNLNWLGMLLPLWSVGFLNMSSIFYGQRNVGLRKPKSIHDHYPQGEVNKLIVVPKSHVCYTGLPVF